jgi:hypothetical protein
VKLELFGANSGQAIADFAKAPLPCRSRSTRRVRESGATKGTPIVQAMPEAQSPPHISPSPTKARVEGEDSRLAADRSRR